MIVNNQPWFRTYLLFCYLAYFPTKQAPQIIYIMIINLECQDKYSPFCQKATYRRIDEAKRIGSRFQFHKHFPALE